MSGAKAIARANDVLRAAEKWYDTRQPIIDHLAFGPHLSPKEWEQAQFVHDFAVKDLENAIRAYRAETKREHAVTPKEAGD